MALHEIPLLSLVAELTTKRELRDRFNREPMAVLKEFGLDQAGDDQMAVFLTMNVNKIADKLKQLVGQLEVRPGEFLPTSEDFFTEDGGTVPQYPSPKPGVFRFRPRKVKGGKGKFEFVVYGQSLVNVKLELKRQSDAATANLDQVHLFGTFRGSVLRTLATPPGAEVTFTAGDKYQVIVTNLPGTALAMDVGPGANRLLEIE